MRVRKANAVLTGLVVLVCVAGIGTAAAQSDRSTHENWSMAEFTRGVYLLENGHADQAIAPLEDAWRESGHAPTVGARLAEAYYAIRDLPRAERVADGVLEKDAANEDALQLKARLCYARHDVHAAITYLERVRDLRPSSFETQRLLASLYAEAGDRDQAIAAIRECIRIEPTVPHLRVLLGDMLDDAGRSDEAEKSYREALALDATDESALQSLSDLLLADGRVDEAIPDLEQSANQPDAPLSSVIALAEAYLRAGRPEDGIGVLEARRGDGKLTPEGEILLGRLYYEAGRNQDALRIFEPMYEHTGRNPELGRIMGELSLRTGHPDKARTYFEEAIAAQPDDYRGYLALFFAQSEKIAGKEPHVKMSPAEAAALLATASPLVAQDDFDANYAMGIALSSVDSLASARRHLLRANELKESDRGTLFNLAAVEEKSGDLESAVGRLEKLHEIVSDDATVNNFYGYVLAELDRDLEHAEALVKSALTKEPDNGYFIDSLGWVYFQRGDYQAAVEKLEQARKILGDDPTILEHLGDAYAALSRYRDALAVYRASDKLQENNRKLREKITSTERRLQ